MEMVLVSGNHAMARYQKTVLGTAIGISAALCCLAGFVVPAIAGGGCAQAPGIGPFAGASCFQDEFAPLVRRGLAGENS